MLKKKKKIPKKTRVEVMHKSSGVSLISTSQKFIFNIHLPFNSLFF